MTNETALDAAMRLLAANPKCKEVKTGTAYVIGGMRPPVVSNDTTELSNNLKADEKDDG
jgi:hypothetical protein